MRIIHTIPATSHESSGPSYSVTRLCESLQGQGHQVTLAALALGASSIKEQRTFALGLGPERLGRSPPMKRWLYQEVLSKKVNILHNHGMWQMNAIYPSWVAKKERIELIVSPRGAFSSWAMQHGSSMKKIFWPLLQKPALKKATCFHATSQAECDDIRRLGFKQPVAIIANGIDIPPFLPKKIHKTRTLLYLGRLHRVKGLEMLIRAWSRLEQRFSDWQLVIVGGDEGYYDKSGYLEELQALVNKLKLQRVFFLGEKFGAEKTQIYHEADLYVLPSYSENFAMTVVEALAVGLPVIVSKGAPWNRLEEKNAGWWIEIGTDPLYACLEKALSLPSSQLQLMGLCGRQWMEESFSWSYIGAKMVKTYEWLIDRSQSMPDWIHCTLDRDA